MALEVFGVIGAGQMGSGIAQVAASCGLEVIMSDIKTEFTQKGFDNIKLSLTKKVNKKKLTEEEKNTILNRIKITTDLNEMKNTDFIVEAATENKTLKLQIFKTLDEICKTNAILATNTSSIPIGSIASSTNRSENIIGMHFMNPVPIMKLVEIIKGIATSDETFKTTWELAIKFGKTPALSGDYPGFIANRILLPMINEAIYALYHSVGTREDIDTVMKLGMNHPLGPLTLADFIGLDTCLAIMETLYNGFKDSKYRPCPLLYKYVEAGWLGKKTGRGFYTY